MDVRWKHHSWFKTCRRNYTELLEEFSLEAAWLHLWETVHFPVYEANKGAFGEGENIDLQGNMKKETLHHNITSAQKRVNENSQVGCSVFNEYVQAPPTGQEWNYS